MPGWCAGEGGSGGGRVWEQGWSGEEGASGEEEVWGGGR